MTLNYNYGLKLSLQARFRTDFFFFLIPHVSLYVICRRELNANEENMVSVSFSFWALLLLHNHWYTSLNRARTAEENS